jgi:hypothetical protein
MEAPPTSPVAVEQDKWTKRAEEKQASIRASQIKYYEKKKAEGLLDKLKEKYDPEERNGMLLLRKKETFLKCKDNIIFVRNKKQKHYLKV